MQIKPHTHSDIYGKIRHNFACDMSSTGSGEICCQATALVYNYTAIDLISTEPGKGHASFIIQLVPTT